jgi:hypothetical protein
VEDMILTKSIIDKILGIDIFVLIRPNASICPVFGGGGNSR